MKSGSFLSGFYRGFTSPSRIFSPLKVERPAKFDASVVSAWRDTGRLLQETLIEEGQRIGKGQKTVRGNAREGVQQTRKRRNRIPA